MFDDNGSFLLAMFEFFIFFAWFMSLWWIFGDLFLSLIHISEPTRPY